MSESGKNSDDPEAQPEKAGQLEKAPARAVDPKLDRLVVKTSVEPTDVPDAAQSIGGWMIIMLWVIGLAMATYLAQGWLDNRTKSREGTWVGNEQGQQALLLRANRYGQYSVKGSANGQEVLFLVDTGASGISIPDGVARKLGLRRGRSFEVNTANGVTTVYATRLDSLYFGPLGRNDVQAHINPSMEGDTALLGMSFLREFEIVHKAGEMTIREVY